MLPALPALVVEEAVMVSAAVVCLESERQAAEHRGVDKVRYHLNKSQLFRRAGHKAAEVDGPTASHQRYMTRS